MIKDKFLGKYLEEVQDFSSWDYKLSHPPPFVKRPIIYYLGLGLGLQLFPVIIKEGVLLGFI